MVRISVVIPLYNKAEYIRGAVVSALAQEDVDVDVEVLVVDDGSTDGGAGIVRDISDARIQLVRQANGGVSAARNAGILRATGDLIAFMDADDVWCRGYLKAIREMVGRWPAANVFSAGYREFVGVPPRWGEVVADGAATARPINFYAMWSKAPFTFTSAIVVRRRALVAAGELFPLGESRGEDQDVWFRLFEAGEWIHCDGQFVGYRREVEGSLSSGLQAELLPCYLRLERRVLARGRHWVRWRDAERLSLKHRCDVAYANAITGRRWRALSLLGSWRAISVGVPFLKVLVAVVVGGRGIRFMKKVRQSARAFGTRSFRVRWDE